MCVMGHLFVHMCICGPLMLIICWLGEYSFGTWVQFSNTIHSAVRLIHKYGPSTIVWLHGKYEKIQCYNWNNLMKTWFLPTSLCPPLSPRDLSPSQKFPLCWVWKLQVITNQQDYGGQGLDKKIFFRKDPVSSSHHSGPCTSDYPQDTTSFSILTRIPVETWRNRLPRDATEFHGLS